MSLISSNPFSAISSIFADMSEQNRLLRSTRQVEDEAQTASAELRGEFQMRQNDGLTIKEGSHAGEISASSKRYRQQAADMSIALSRLREEDPAQADFSTSVAMQILGVETTGSEFADMILTAIRNGDSTDDSFLSARYTIPDAAGSAAADDISVDTDGTIFGVRGGDGADRVSLRGGQVMDVHTDATASLSVTIAKPKDSKTWNVFQTFSNNDRLDISAGQVSVVNTGGGDDQIRMDADYVERVSAGTGDDRLRVTADYAASIDAGAGNDIITLRATIAEGIRGGDGSDAISVTAARGSVDGGAGADLIRVSATEALSVEGGAGDDLITVENGGGTVTLERRGSDGDDIVELKAGASVVLEVGHPTSMERDGDLLTLRFSDGGSMTLIGMENAGTVTLGNGQDLPTVLSPVSNEGIDLRL